MAIQANSTRRALLARLMAPLLLLTLISGASAYGLARYFTDVVLDQWLYDSAISLANAVRWEDGRASIDLSPGAREILEWDLVDHFFYEVTDPMGEPLAGNALLPHPAHWQALPGSTFYFESTVNGAAVRVAAVSVPLKAGGRVIVKVAETLNKRTTLALQVLWISLALSLVLVAASAALTWYGIGSGIATMERAVRRVRALHAEAPLEPVSFGGDMPSEVAPLLEEINDLIRDLSAAHRLNQRFIADAAHQLRTPLATLRVRLETALRESDPGRQRGALDNAVGALTRMSHLLHQLLTLARADHDHQETLGETDIDLVAREEVERRVDDAVGLGVDLGYSGLASPVLVRAHGDLVREAVANLVDNALRYGASGRHVTVGVSSSPPEIFVEDGGPGIPQEERAKVCDRFYRSPGSPGEGCGLGLPIVKEIARRSGASLLLQNPGSGSGLRARLVFSRA